jgi:hypothetical protein
LVAVARVVDQLALAVVVALVVIVLNPTKTVGLGMT